MIDRSFIGLELPGVVTQVERGRLRTYARAIGETDPVYFDPDAARQAGYRDIPAPPCYAFCLEMLDEHDPFSVLKTLGVPLAKALHGEQRFTYHAPICAGDRITLAARIVDIYERKNGELEFIVQETTATDDQGRLMVEMRRVVIVRHADSHA